MVRAVVFDIGETLVRDDRYWGSWADWLGVPRHTMSALVGAVTALGLDNAEALRMIRPGIDLQAAYRDREESGGPERPLPGLQVAAREAVRWRLESQTAPAVTELCGFAEWLGLSR